MLFLQACLLGVALGIFYDCLRFLRESLPAGRWFLFFEDLLFCGAALLATLIFLVGANHGQLRAWCIAGELFGLWLYFQSVSRILLWGFRHLRRLTRAICRPVVRLLSAIRGKFASLFVKVLKNIDFSRWKHLKKQCRIVYNKTDKIKKGGVFRWRRKIKPESSKGSLSR